MFTLIPGKVTHGPFSCCYNYAIVGHICVQIFNFIDLSAITDYQSLLTPHFSKIHLPIFSLTVRELDMN